MIKYFYILFLLFLEITIVDAQNLSVSFDKTNRECELGKASVTVISGAQPVSILWSNGSVMNTIEQLEVGDYSVTITDSLSNDTTLFFSIETLLCEPYVQNHFTPNADGYNDTWSIGRLENFPEFDLFVYNRWGQQVHHQTDVYFPWDGKSFSLQLPDATYYYILYLSKTDKNKFIKGNVSIIR